MVPIPSWFKCAKVVIFEHEPRWTMTDGYPGRLGLKVAKFVKALMSVPAEQRGDIFDLIELMGATLEFESGGRLGGEGLGWSQTDHEGWLYELTVDEQGDPDDVMVTVTPPPELGGLTETMVLADFRAWCETWKMPPASFFSK